MGRETLSPSPETHVIIGSEQLNFPAGSLGAPLVESLKGRERPVKLFEQDLDAGRHRSYRLSLPKGIAGHLENAGITTVSALLSKSLEEVAAVRGIGPRSVAVIVEMVADFSREIKFTPQVHFLGSIFIWGEPKDLTPKFTPTQEKRLQKAVTKALSKLNDEEALVLKWLYGLEDWENKPPQYVITNLFLETFTFKSIRDRAFRKLRQYPDFRPEKRALTPYLSQIVWSA